MAGDAMAQGFRRTRGLVLKEYLHSVAIIALTATAGILLRPYLKITDLAMLLLLAVVVVAYQHRRGPAVLASLLSIAVFDFWFVPPYHTFDVHDKAYFLTFGVMLAVALAMSQLTARIREQAEDAREREHRTAALFGMSWELASAGNLEAQIGIAARHVERAGRGHSSVLLHDPNETTGTGCW